MTCELCQEGIHPGDVSRGVKTMIAHRECLLRSGIGGIGHLLDHAHFCKGDLGPDAGLSYRLSALLVDAYVAHVGVSETVARSVIPE